MSVQLPRADMPIQQPNGSFTREWYKSLANTASTVNSAIPNSIFADTGAVNAMVISSQATNLTKALVRYLLPAHTNTSTAVTLNDSKLGAHAVIFSNGSLPVVGQIVAGVTLEVIYNGSSWEIQSLQAANQSIPGTLTTAGALKVLSEMDLGVSGPGTAGQPLLSAGAGAAPTWGAAGYTGTIVTASLGVAQGSMTFANGILTSQVAAT
jgi:hypothetical protein